MQFLDTKQPILVRTYAAADAAAADPVYLLFYLVSDFYLSYSVSVRTSKQSMLLQFTDKINDPP